jgi:GDP/UDP-N,N'-diacetylbacillosamine 2-epimerase (hydrolysing)
VVATPPNLDGCSDALQRVMQQSRQQHPGIVWANHLGRRKYLSWLSVCSAVVGNTSSGLYESPLFNKPSLTIGPRQQGRERGTNVVAVGYGKASVLAGLKTVLEDASFIEGCMRTVSPFGHHPAAPEITEALLYWLTEPASRANVSY